MRHIKKNQLSILITAVLLGFLIMLQARSFGDVSDVLNRNTRTDIFKEIQVLKTTNEGLADEINNLESQLSKTSNNQEALEGVRSQIASYELLTGKKDISGPGVQVKIRGQIKSLWLIDMVNELLSSGAEAVSINSIRLTNKTNGFDTIPNGQILLNSVILNEPYVIEAIGDKDVMDTALSQQQGIIDRMKQLSGVEVSLEKKDLITMTQTPASLPLNKEKPKGLE